MTLSSPAIRLTREQRLDLGIGCKWLFLEIIRARKSFFSDRGTIVLWSRLEFAQDSGATVIRTELTMC